MTSHGVLLLGAGIVLAVLLGRALWLRRRPAPLELFAAALLAYPVARALVATVPVLDRLTRYTVLLPAPREAFELAIVRDVGFGVLLPLAGALLLFRARAGQDALRGLRDLRDALARVLEPVGVRLAASWRRGLLDGLGLLALVLVLQLVALALQGSIARALVTGDESQYWRNLDLPLVLGLSFAAGLSEEFVWRGALLRGLLTRLPWVPALLLQGLLFGFIHAGYGTWAHVVGPAIFGVLMGLVALRVGLLAAVLIHAGTNVVYLALAAPALQPLALPLLAALLLAGAAALGVTRFGAVRALLEGLPVPRRLRGRGAAR